MKHDLTQEELAPQQADSCSEKQLFSLHAYCHCWHGNHHLRTETLWDADTAAASCVPETSSLFSL